MLCHIAFAKSFWTALGTGIGIGLMWLCDMITKSVIKIMCWNLVVVYFACISLFSALAISISAIIAWKDLSLKWPVMWQLGCKTRLDYLLIVSVGC